MIVAASNDRTQGTRYLYDRAADKLDEARRRAAVAARSEDGAQKPIVYTSRDGLTINGYLTLPNGKEAKNLPVIVNPHGGPWFRDRGASIRRCSSSRAAATRCCR